MTPQLEIEKESDDEPVTCPNEIDGEECGRALHIREYSRDPQFDTEPAGPVKEAICVMCGVVESV